MEKLYSILAKWLVDNTNAPCENYEIYKYGFQTSFEQGAFIVTSLTIALLINSLGEMLLFLLVFFLVRPFIGGIHFKNFSHCYCVSVICSVAVVSLSKYSGIPLYISASILFCLIFITYIILISQSKKLEKKEYQYYKKKLILHLVIVGIIVFVLVILAVARGVNIVILTLMLTNISFVFEKLKIKQ